MGRWQAYNRRRWCGEMDRLNAAIERAVQRMIAVHERDMAADQEALAIGQDQLLAEWREAVQSDEGVAAFKAAHGEDGWRRQINLAMQRARRGGE